MKKYFKPEPLAWFVPVMGILCALVRWWLFATGLDEKNMLISSHPGNWLTWVLTALTLGTIVYGTLNLKQAPKYSFNFPASLFSAIGAAVAAVCILFVAFSSFSGSRDLLGVLDGILGLIGAAALGFLSYCRYKGLHPSLIFHSVICAYLMVHLVCLYRLWSADPQIQDYAFSLLATVSLMLANYYSAAFDANFGQRRPHAAFHLAAVYFCIVSLPYSDNALFYIAMAAWMLTDLCNLTPMPKEVR